MSTNFSEVITRARNELVPQKKSDDPSGGGTIARRVVINKFRCTVIDINQYSLEFRGSGFYQKVECVITIAITALLTTLLGGIVAGLAYHNPLIGVLVCGGSTITILGVSTLTIKWFKYENGEEPLTKVQIDSIIDRIEATENPTFKKPILYRLIEFV